MNPSSSRGWFEDQDVTGKLRAIQMASCLLQGPAEVGNRVLELSGIMESILALCASSREADQLVAVEALIHAADKAKRATFITTNGASLLKEIYKHSERDSIRIRALVVSRGLAGMGGSRAGVDWCQQQHNGQLFSSGSLQAGLCRGHGLQHEAVCRRLYPQAGQAVPQVSVLGGDKQKQASSRCW